MTNNVLQWHCGGINISGTRIGTGGTLPPPGLDETVGKWPGNVIVLHTSDCHMKGHVVVSNVINRWSDGAKPFGGGAGHPYESVGTTEYIEQWECSDDCINKSLGKGPDGNDLGHFFKNVGNAHDLWRYLIDLISPPAEYEPVVLAEPSLSPEVREFDWSYLPDQTIHGIVIEGKVANYVDEIMRILRPGAHCLVVSDWNDAMGWRSMCALEDRGFEIRDSICILDHLEDHAHYVAKASVKERNAGLPGTLENKHETLKPIAVMEALLQDLPSGSVVVDPFMGTATTGIACLKRQCHFIGIEKEEPSFEIAHHRVHHWDTAHASWNPSCIESDLKNKDEDKALSLEELFGHE